MSVTEHLYSGERQKFTPLLLMLALLVEIHMLNSYTVIISDLKKEVGLCWSVLRWESSEEHQLLSAELSIRQSPFPDRTST